MFSSPQSSPLLLQLSDEIEQGIGDALDYLEDSFETTNILPVSRDGAAVLQKTPSILTHLPVECNSKKKRVEFSPWTKYLAAPDHHSENSEDRQPFSPATLSRHTKSVKSILKSHTITSPLQKIDNNVVRNSALLIHRVDTFGGMLESALEQLSSDSLEMRLDAYIVVHGAIKSFDPDVDSFILTQKGHALQSHLRKDIAARKNSSSLHKQLVVQAFKTLITLIRIGAFQNAITDDFATFIVESSIDVLADKAMPKQIAIYYLQLLAMQNFSRKVTSPDRVETLLSVLVTLEQRFCGNNIIRIRLMVYQRLLLQNRSAVLSRMKDWIGHLFDGMLCNVKELRTRAIDISIAIALSLNGNNQSAKAVMDLFDSKLRTGQTYAEYVASQLSEMVSKSNDTAVVPQIWAVPVLFLRPGRSRIVQWRHLKLWLTTIQRCMTIGDLRTRFMAYHAWNQFVWAVDMDLNTPEFMQSLVLRPIASGLTREVKEKVSEKARVIYLNSYYNLLYISLRPGSSVGHLDKFWDKYVSAVLETMARRSAKEASRACCILSSLFRTNRSYTWYENRTNESRKYNIEELPQLESRWIRLRTKKIVSTISICLRNASWNAEAGVFPPVQKMWLALMEAIAEAGSKEINTSSELKDALAQIMNLLLDLWNNVESLGDSGDSINIRISHFIFLVEALIDTLKPLHFVTPSLQRAMSNGFEAFSSASHKNIRPTIQHRPLYEILSWLMNSAYVDEETSKESIIEGINNIIRSCNDSPSTKQGLIDILLKLCNIPAERNVSTSLLISAKAVWLALVDLVAFGKDAGAELAAKRDDITNNGSNVFYQTIHSGLMFNSCETIGAMQSILTQYADHVKTIAGQEGLATAIIEPLAQMASSYKHKIDSQLILFLYNSFLKFNSHPHNRRSIEKTANALNLYYVREKRKLFDPYLNFSNMIAQVLNQTHEHIEDYKVEQIDEMLIQLALFIDATPLSQVAMLLRKTQGGLASWVKSDKFRVNDQGDQRSLIIPRIYQLWSSILSSLERVSKKGSVLLNAIGDLMVAGFSASSQDIVNETVKFWNSSFGQENSLEYPEELLGVLSAIRRKQNLELPSFPIEADLETISVASDLTVSASGDMHHSTPLHITIEPNDRSIVKSMPTPMKMTSMEINDILTALDTRSDRQNGPVEDSSKASHMEIDDSDCDSQQHRIGSQVMLERQDERVAKNNEEDLGMAGATPTQRIVEAEKNSPEPTGQEEGLSKINEILHKPSEMLENPKPSLPTISHTSPAKCQPKEAHEAVEATAFSTASKSAALTDTTEQKRKTLPPNANNGNNDHVILIEDSTCQEDDLDFTNTTLYTNIPDDNNNDNSNTSQPVALQVKENLRTDEPEHLLSTEAEPVQDQGSFLVDHNVNVDTDSFTAADSLLLPSELHYPIDKERFATPSEEIETIGSSTNEMSIPWESYLNSSPPVIGNGNETGMTTVCPEAEDAAAEEVFHETSSISPSSVKYRNAEQVVEMTPDDQARVPTETPPGVEADVQQDESTSVLVKDSFRQKHVRNEVEDDDQLNLSANDRPNSPKTPSTPKRKRVNGSVNSNSGKKRQKFNITVDHDISQAAVTSEDLNTNTAGNNHEESERHSDNALDEESSIHSRGHSRNRSDSLSPLNNTVRDEGIDASSAKASESENTNTTKRRRSLRNDDNVKHTELAPSKRHKRSERGYSLSHVQITTSQPGSNVTTDAAKAKSTSRSEEPSKEIDDVNARCTTTPSRPNSVEFVDALESSPASSSSRKMDQRPKAKPASILGRLKRILSDCKQMVLGSQEEREFDDMLFEVRKEVHEAGRRGQGA